MKLIVGLGNPDLKHEKTRHNFGFMVIESLFKHLSTPKENLREEKKFHSEIAEINWQSKKSKDQKIILIRPLTYMNNSGMAVKAISDFYKISSEDIWVIHDEIDLPLGAMKIRLGGSSAGHKGVESIMEHLKSEKFWRFRMGIGKQTQKEKIAGKRVKPIDDYVLGEFGEGERGKQRELIKRGVKSIQEALEEGLEKAMNRFNTK